VTLHSVKKTVVLLQLSLVVLVAGASFASGQEGQDAEALPEGAQYLPAGEGRTLMLQGCVQCHDQRNSVSQRKTEAGWRRTVNEMIWRGAPLMADEAETITRYLAESFGPGKPVPDALKKKSAGDKR
jgi:mono/diheme cytochrome c family protein